MGNQTTLLLGGQPISQAQTEGGQFHYQGMDPNQAIEEQALNRRQQIANLLLQQGLAPTPAGQMVGRFFVRSSPMEGISQLARAAVGLYGSHKIDQARAKLASDQQEALTGAIHNYFGNKGGATAPASGLAAPAPAIPSQEAPPIETQPGVALPVGNSNGHPYFNQMPGANPGVGQFPPMGLPGSTEPPGMNVGTNSYQMQPDQSVQAPPAPQEAVAAAMTAPAGGPSPGAGPPSEAAPPPSDKMQRIIQLMASRDPRAAQIGNFLAQHEAKGQDLAAQREFLQSEHAKDRTSREDQASNHMDVLVGLGLMTKEQKDAMLEQQKVASARHDETLRAMNAATNAARLQAEHGAKVPAGYRTLPNGDLEAIPGGPADLKLQGALNQDTQTLNSSTAGMDRLAQSANDLLNHPGLAGITGLRGKIPNVPGTAAADAEAKLSTLKSQVGFGVLQEMRNNSKSGGALGQISDKEEKLLQDNLAALDKAQSLSQMKESLQKILTYTDESKGRFQDAYNMKHKTMAPPPTSPLPAGAGMTPTVPAFHDPEKQKRYEEFKRNHTP